MCLSKFKKSAQYYEVPWRVWSWMVGHEATDWQFEHHAAAMFEGMFLPVDEDVITFFKSQAFDSEQAGPQVYGSHSFAHQ